MAGQCIHVRRRMCRTIDEYVEFRCMNYTIRNRDYCWKCWNRFLKTVETHERELEERKKEEKEHLAYDTDRRRREGTGVE